ncbi:YfbM family protein [Myxococcus sp. K15C18031901]|uniref:DUF1877 family protein n=1 Tax=Myxococcus dinghuensis TaxID=2906761 RepID=UPI0020A7B363|nr:DUF1877 family protein [Myxococcus dinghuensis]MCP3100731.1 YfbM family protein [Myxococcus dinghuensis]
MAMVTWIQMLTDEEVAALKKAPDTITSLDKPAGEKLATQLYTAINYFLTGAAYPAKKHPLSAVLGGEKRVKAKSVESGGFDLTTAATVVRLSAALTKVELAKIKSAIKKADFDELRDTEEVDEECVLEDSDNDEAAAAVIAEIKALQKFFASAARKKRSLVTYTD